MATIRSDGKTIGSGINPGGTSGTSRGSNNEISSGYGSSGTSHGGPEITSGMHGPGAGNSPFKTLNQGDTLDINSVTYTYQQVISKSSGEAEIFLLSRNGTHCVFKLYYPNFKPKEAILEQLKQLNHEDIINVLDYGYHQDRFYEIMDFAEGGTLEEYLPIQQAKQLKQIIREIINAYHFCHSHGIVHKDIKPQNLYYKNLDGTDLLIGDFGISSYLDSGMSRQLTKQNLTFGYAAPEMYGHGGEVIVGKEVDYYALGVTLIHLWRGKSPFEGLGIHAIANATTSGNIHIPEDIPRDIQKLIKGLLTVDYTKRWGYAEVQRWLNGEEVAVHFEKKELNYPPYNFGPNQVASTAEELADILKNNFDKGRKHLYSGKLSAWINIFNQGLAVEMDRIIEDDYPTDQKAGLQKAIYVLDSNAAYTQSGKEYRSTDELATALENDTGLNSDVDISNPNHPFFLYLEAREAQVEADTFRQYFKTFSKKKALNTIILELQSRNTLKIAGQEYHTPEELLKHESLTQLASDLKDEESKLSLWIEGSEFSEIKNQVKKWRTMVGDAATTINYALKKGSPFNFPDHDKAYSRADFLKKFLEKINDDTFLSEVVNKSTFAAKANFWLKNYHNTSYKSLLLRILHEIEITENKDNTTRRLQLFRYFMENGEEKYYLRTIDPLIEKLYTRGGIFKSLYTSHLLFLIKDIEIYCFGKSISELNQLWQSSLKEQDEHTWNSYFVEIGKQLIVKKLSHIQKNSLSELKEIGIEESGSFFNNLANLAKLLKIPENSEGSNIHNFNFSNAYQACTKGITDTLTQPTSRDWYVKLDTPFQNIKRLIPNGFFCIDSDHYASFIFAKH